MSAAFKYALFETFAIPTEEQAKNDSDHEHPEMTPLATAKDKGALIAQIAKWRGDETDMPHVEFATSVVRQLFPADVQLTVADLDTIKEAVLAGKFDKATGDRIPEAADAQGADAPLPSILTQQPDRRTA